MKGLHAEEYHYTAMGRVTSKTMKVTRKYPNNADLPEPKELTASMVMGYTYNQGTAAQTTYPTTFTQPLINQPWNTVVGPRFEYSYDAMWRLAGETKADWNPGTSNYGTPASLVSGITYNFNSQLTAITMPNGIYGTLTETRQYNGLLQLSRLTAVSSSNGTQLDEEYKYSATQNDGRLTSLKNWQSGEEVVYQYDSLQRLASAVTVGPEWGMSWVYDGFGNRTAQNVVKGSVPVQSINVDMNTNRVTSWSYDSNGNATSIPGIGTITYDASNRVKTVGGEIYEYAPSNKRIWKNDTFTFWGGKGERVGTYSVTLMSDTTGSPTQWKLAFVKQTEDWYFGSRRLNQVQDRLGSVRRDSSLTSQSYYPYGEERTSTANPADKFATYHRDGTGLDYAQQRYYATGSGRFITSDPRIITARPSDPLSWNLYTYVEGDPITYVDPLGLDTTIIIGNGQFRTCISGEGSSNCFDWSIADRLDGGSRVPVTSAEYDQIIADSWKYANQVFSDCRDLAQRRYDSEYARLGGADLKPVIETYEKLSYGIQAAIPLASLVPIGRMISLATRSTAAVVNFLMRAATYEEMGAAAAMAIAGFVADWWYSNSLAVAAWSAKHPTLNMSVSEALEGLDRAGTNLQRDRQDCQSSYSMMGRWINSTVANNLMIVP